MKDFEISIKSKPDGTGAEVYLRGAPDDLVMNFCVLAASLCERAHLPPAALAMLVVQCREITEKVVKDHIAMDLGALRRSAGEK